MLLRIKRIHNSFILVILFKRFATSIKWNSWNSGNNGTALQINFNTYLFELNKECRYKENCTNKFISKDLKCFPSCHHYKRVIKNEKKINAFLNSLSKIKKEAKEIYAYKKRKLNFFFFKIYIQKKKIDNILYVTKKEKWIDKKENQCGKEIKEGDKYCFDTFKNDSKEMKQLEKKENIRRIFLTDTKYYKRSKYSKAGWINKDDNKYINKTKTNFLDDEYGKELYVESIEELIKKKNNYHAENKSNESLSNTLLRNYFLDQNKLNTLDLMHHIKYDNEGIKEIKSKETYKEYQKNEDDTTELLMNKELNNHNNNYNKTNNSNKEYIMNNMEIKTKNVSDTYKRENTNRSKIDFMNEFTVIGEIVGIHGLSGFVKVVSFTTFNDVRFQNNCYRYIFMNNYPYPLPIKIEKMKESLKVNFLYVKFYNVNSRSDAMKLKNCLICVDKKDIPQIEENHYLSTDLINFNIYIFNDFSNTCIGRIKSFVSRHDYIHSRDIQQIADDLIQIELDKQVSLKTVFHIMNLSSKNRQNIENTENDEVEKLQLQSLKSVKVLINKNNFNLCEKNSNDSFISSDKDRKETSEDSDNLDGFSYKKIFKCDYCNYVFDNIKEASDHENSHFEAEENVINLENIHKKKEKIYEITEKNVNKVKNVEYFFIPLIKQKTIHSVHYELKNIYLDISTIFLVDN